MLTAGGAPLAPATRTATTWEVDARQSDDTTAAPAQRRDLVPIMNARSSSR